MTLLRITGNMDWFRVAEQPSSMSELPDVFASMKSKWEDDPEANRKIVVDALESFVWGRFVADNLSDWEDFFDASTYGEFEATSCSVTGFDFSSSPIPLCKVEAQFDIPLKEGVTVEEVIAWNDEVLQGDLYSALVFYWDFDDSEDLEDLDLTVGDHNGCEATIITQD